jgi:hypothetical protein
MKLLDLFFLAGATLLGASVLNTRLPMHQAGVVHPDMRSSSSHHLMSPRSCLDLVAYALPYKFDQSGMDSESP